MDQDITAFNVNEKFIANYCGVSVDTVRGWRKRKQGPAYRKLNGRVVRYSLQSLIEWVNAQPTDRKRSVA